MNANLGSKLSTDEIAPRYLEGQSSTRIARDLGCTVRTVFVRLAKAGVKARGQGKVKPTGPANPRWTGGRLAATRRWNLANPDRSALASSVEGKVRYALRSGRIVRPDTCEQCGRHCKPDAAHGDYSRPLEIRWLCRQCHVRWDHADPKTVKLYESSPLGSLGDEAVAEFGRLFRLIEQRQMAGWQDTVSAFEQDGTA